MTEDLNNLLAELEDQIDEKDPERGLSLSTIPTAEIVEREEQEDNITKEMVARFRDRFDKMCFREEEDRQGLKNTIKFLEGLCFNNTSPKVGHVEQLVGAYRVLIDSNSNAVRGLDALSKLMSAGKGTSIMVQNNMSQMSSQEEIMQLLEEDDGQ